MATRDRASRPDNPDETPETPAGAPAQSPALAPAPENRAAASSGPGTAASGSRGFCDARESHLRDLGRELDASQHRTALAGRDYLRRLQEAEIEAQLRGLKAYRTYTRAVDEAAGAEDEPDRVLTAYAAYLRELDDAWGLEGLQRQAAEAWQSYGQALADESRRTREACHRAHLDYLRALQQAFAGSDVNELNAADLTCLAGDLLSAAQLSWSAPAA